MLSEATVKACRGLFSSQLPAPSQPHVEAQPPRQPQLNLGLLLLAFVE